MSAFAAATIVCGCGAWLLASIKRIVRAVVSFRGRRRRRRLLRPLVPARERGLVRLLQLGVVEPYRGLRPQPIEVLFALFTKLRLADLVPDIGSRLVERSHLRLAARFEFQNLIATLRAKNARDVADLHPLEHLPERGRELLGVQRADEATVRL